ncbi:hypothetical protein BJX63DRAFT_73439 [Aspergillus granulosus]|uniref:Transmembrane protein n=1 Tax=Aspergillus granulosus TaxID=176169 RepID=A0ABR4HUL0_9EURO
MCIIRSRTVLFTSGYTVYLQPFEFAKLAGWLAPLFMYLLNIFFFFFFSPHRWECVLIEFKFIRADFCLVCLRFMLGVLRFWENWEWQDERYRYHVLLGR